MIRTTETQQIPLEWVTPQPWASPAAPGQHANEIAPARREPPAVASSDGRRGDDDGNGGESDSKVRTCSSTWEAKHPPMDAPMIRDEGADEREVAGRGRDVAVARTAAVAAAQIARSARPGAVHPSPGCRWLRDAPASYLNSGWHAGMTVMCRNGDPSELGALFAAPSGAVSHPDPNYQLRAREGPPSKWGAWEGFTLIHFAVWRLYNVRLVPGGAVFYIREVLRRRSRAR